MPPDVLTAEMLSQAAQALLSALAILSFARITRRVVDPAAAR